jgi:hypothetical protein
MDRRGRHRHRAGREIPRPNRTGALPIFVEGGRLDGFDDDPKMSNEPKLEAIQMAWVREFGTPRSDSDIFRPGMRAYSSRLSRAWCSLRARSCRGSSSRDVD